MLPCTSAQLIQGSDFHTFSNTHDLNHGFDFFKNFKITLTVSTFRYSKNVTYLLVSCFTGLLFLEYMFHSFEIIKREIYCGLGISKIKLCILKDDVNGI